MQIVALNWGSLTGLIAVVVLLIASALVSGSEVAYFSLEPKDKQEIEKKKSRAYTYMKALLVNPEKLLATILISNNLVNVAIIIITSYLSSIMIDFGDRFVLKFIFQVIFITFLLLLFGEILPKVYASKHPLRFAAFMAYPLYFSQKLFYPLSALLMGSSSFIRKRFQRNQVISIDDLSEAFDLTEKNLDEDKDILKGIVRFGSTDVSEIMRSRLDIVALDLTTHFKKLLQVVIDSGYSRIPVYDSDIDHIKGVLYIKDLLPFISESDDFQWQKLIRETYFVPESKKIDDLLEEFKVHKNHLAIVIDEYGGTSGLVTLEDILEEIIGEITDEFDDENTHYTRIDENHYIFEGRTLLNDFFKIVDEKDDYFDEERGDADTLAGLILEQTESMPGKHFQLTIKNYQFTIESVDERRIKQIKVQINRPRNKQTEN